MDSRRYCFGPSAGRQIGRQAPEAGGPARVTRAQGESPPVPDFRPLNPAYNTVYRPGRLSLGQVVPLETYPRPIDAQARIIADWRARIRAIGRIAQPAMQSLYIDLVDDPKTLPRPIHLGYRLGADALRSHLKSLQAIGVNHVALNLRFNQADMETTMQHLADTVLPEFMA